MSYLSREVAPKQRTSGSDIDPGSISVRHLSPALFLELQKISLHTHEGSISPVLRIQSLPEALRGYVLEQRVESYKVTWTGGAAGNGSVALTFGNPFNSAPIVVAVAAGRASADIKITTDGVTVTGCTIYWKLDSGTATSVDISVFVIGR